MTQLSRPCKFYFIRHGESMANKNHQVQGKEESPLSPLGLSQAQETAQWFKDKHINCIFSSPLKRAYQTASIIAEQLDIKVQKKPIMQELDTGILSGLSFKQIRTDYTHLWKHFLLHSWEGIPQAESIKSLRKRALAIWQLLLRHHQNTPLLAVMHEGILQWILKVTFCTKEKQWMPLFQIENCGIFLFSAHPIMFKKQRSYIGTWKLLNHKAYRFSE